MGIVSSSPSNPTSEPQPPSPATSSTRTMSSPDQEPKTLDENSNKLEKDNEESSQKAEGEGEEEAGEGECGFCLFMKGGGCKEAFINWENCVMESENKSEDIVEKCHEVTFQLKKCMEAHADYYEPILKAEKAAEEEVAKELEKEKLQQQPGDDNNAHAGGNHQSSHTQETVN